MTPPEYILDKRFETILVAGAEGDKPTEIIEGKDFAHWLLQYPPEDTATVTFNALFDNGILAWQYGYVPHRMYCTMAMARALRGHLLASASLASVSKLLGLPDKGAYIANMMGVHRRDMTEWMLRDFGAYAITDNDNNREIFRRLIPEFPKSEQRILDRVLRCAIQPQFMIDQQLLEQHLTDIRNEQNATILKLAKQYAA